MPLNSRSSRPTTPGAALLSFLLAVASTVALATTASGQQVVSAGIARESFAGITSEVGLFQIEVSFSSLTTPAPQFVNLDEDAAYEFINVFADLGSGQEWIVRNVPLFHVPGTTNDAGGVSQGVVFELPSGITSYTDLDVYLSHDPSDGAVPTSLLDSFSDAGPTGVGTANQLASGSGGKEGSASIVETTTFPSPLNPSHYDGLEPRIIFDEKLRENVPDYEQDLNNADIDTDFPPDAETEDNRGHDECGPTSTANSFRWLQKTYEYKNLPAKTPNGFTKDDDLITRLVDCMDTNLYRTGNGSKEGDQGKPEAGTKDRDFVNGKIRCAKEFKMPIVVEFQDGNSTINGQPQQPPTAMWIWDQLRLGQDVELGFTFTGDNSGGHWVTLVGGIHWSDGSYGVYINDPDDGVEETVYYELGTRVVGGETYFEILGYGARNFVDIAAAESPRENVPALSAMGLVALAGLVGLGGLVAARRRTGTSEMA